jgi:hypothetical protein
MTIAPSRVEGHRRFLEKASKVGGVISARSASEYLAILDDYSALKAEVKRLNTWHSTLSEAWKARAEKAEAELATQAPSPAPTIKKDLTVEAEEAMEKIITRLEGRGCSEEIDVIKAALRPKVVSRGWVGELVEVARWGDKDGGYARVKSRLCSELGVVVGD